MRTMCSREIFTNKCRQQQIFDSDLKGAWHYNHVTFTPIAKNFMLYCILIYMLSILCVRLTIKVKVGIPESFKIGWYPPKKLGRVTLRLTVKIFQIFQCLRLSTKFLAVLHLSVNPIETLVNAPTPGTRICVTLVLACMTGAL